jgi:hypothetical protein
MPVCIHEERNRLNLRNACCHAVQNPDFWSVIETSEAEKIYFLKNPLSARFEPVNLGYSGMHDNHYSTENTFLIT